MKSLEQIRRDNTIERPWEHLPMNLPRKEATDELLQLHGRYLHLLLLRIVYDAQLEVFEHFGKGEKEFHKWKEEKAEALVKRGDRDE